MSTSTAPPVAALPGIDWVEIPGGDYIYQNGKSRTLPTFYMARHPITNGCGSFEPRFLGDHAANLMSSFWGADT